MTLISLTDCCRLLAIDAKTLRRWLAQAQLSLQPHPTDGRLKGLTADHLRLLASRHHRSLAALPADLPMPALALPAQEPSLLPRDLLELLQALSTLPAQIVALQQQLALLTQRLEQPPLPPPVTVSQAHHAERLGGHPLPAKALATSRSSAAAPPRPKPLAHVLPRVEYAQAGRYVVICPKHGLLPLAPDTPEWFAWLATQSSFRFVGKLGRLTAHHECVRVPNGAWRAHRHIRNHSYTLRLALTQDLTIAVLEQAAEVLQAHLT